MLSTRVIPCLLLKDGGLVKTVKFKNPKYVGDPINAVRIFNEKEVDELVFLDIGATNIGVGAISRYCFDKYLQPCGRRLSGDETGFGALASIRVRDIRLPHPGAMRNVHRSG